MDLNDNTVSWMIGGGLRGDPAERRNRAHLQALRHAQTRPSPIERLRACLTGSPLVTAAPVDRIGCTA